MALIDGLMQLFPSATPGVDYVLQNDGEDDYIKAWNLTATQPTAAALATAETAAIAAKEQAANNETIKAQLAELDGKSVRALHEAVLALAASGAALPADTTKRLQDLETQKQALRAKLV